MNRTSIRLRFGEDAIAIGSPLTVTSGVVSDLRTPGDEATASVELLGGAIQTDAVINPDGPLFNPDSELIGVNTALLSITAGDLVGGE